MLLKRIELILFWQISTNKDLINEYKETRGVNFSNKDTDSNIVVSDDYFKIRWYQSYTWYSETEKKKFSLQNQMNWEEFIRENTLLVVSDSNLLNTIPLSKR